MGFVLPHAPAMAFCFATSLNQMLELTLPKFVYKQFYPMEVIHLSYLLRLQKVSEHKCPFEIPLLKQQIYETVAFSCGCDPHEA